ncbi:MAG: hypothetical protein HGA31_02385 [Candidatus Moranbacteria bacterium]|nr:hypothetical protein [Candidatus Moranbacteria bacterium]
MADYIQAIYKFALWAVGIAAMFMIAVGGMMYLTSAGNTSQTSSAKKVIFDALIGLALAIIAWLILYVINPDLVMVSLNFGAATINSTTEATPVATDETGVTTPTVAAGSCGGLGTQSGIDRQCGDASAALSTLLTCIKGRVPNAVLSSISDSAGFTECKTNWSDRKCAHARTSCHYGGGASKTATECQQSQAADLSVGGDINSQLSRDIQSAASACGGRVNPEGRPAHVHVSTQTSCCTL